MLSQLLPLCTPGATQQGQAEQTCPVSMHMEKIVDNDVTVAVMTLVVIGDGIACCASHGNEDNGDPDGSEADDGDDIL